MRAPGDTLHAANTDHEYRHGPLHNGHTRPRRPASEDEHVQKDITGPSLQWWIFHHDRVHSAGDVCHGSQSILTVPIKHFLVLLVAIL